MLNPNFIRFARLLSRQRPLKEEYYKAVGVMYGVWTKVKLLINRRN